METNKQKTLDEAQVSCFTTAWDKKPITTTSLIDVLKNIQSGVWKDRVEKMRELVKNGEHDAYAHQKRGLPAIAVSGVCTSRDAKLSLAEKFTTHSGFLQCDFDKKENPQLATSDNFNSLREKLIFDEHVVAFFVSPSGEGLKVVARIPADIGKHVGSFLAAEKHFAEKYGLTMDKSTKDPLRLCFCSFDPDAFWREGSGTVPFEPLAAPKRATRPAAASAPSGEGCDATTAEDIAEMLTFIEPFPDYDKWFRISSAVFSVLSLEEGFNVLNNWSPESTAGEYAKRWRSRGKQIGIGTLVHYAKEGGFDPRAAMQRKRWCGRIVFGGKTVEDLSASSARNIDKRLAGMEAQEVLEQAASSEISTDFILECWNGGQRGDAKLWLSQTAGTVRFSTNGKSWFNYRDGIWLRDKISRTREDMQSSLVDTYQAAKKTIFGELTERAETKQNKEEVKELKSLNKHILDVSSNNYIRGIEEIAQKRVGVSLEDFDQQPHLLVCKNHTIDLSTCEAREHLASDLITKKIPANFDIDAKCPKWEKFLEEIFQGDEAVIRFVQRAVGYSLSGFVDADALFLLLGNGANGKSTFRAGIELLMGDYTSQIKINTLLGGKYEAHDAAYDKAHLQGARIVFTDEIPDGRKFNESELKAISGGDLIQARPIYGDFIYFKPTHKLWLIGNHKPEIHDATDGTWRRLNLIYFKKQFAVNERRDRSEMLREFQAELSGMLNWALAGWIEYQRIKLSPPESVRNAVSEYKSEYDQLGAFLSENFEECPGEKLKIKIVFHVFQNWCEENGEKLRFRTSNKLIHALVDIGCVVKIGTGKVNYLHGKKLVGATADEETEDGGLF
jgi:P4 family phage/plasmid primase-like protien